MAKKNLVMNEYIMDRESLKRHCEATCHQFKDVPTSGTYGEHRFVLDLLEQTTWIPVSERLPKAYEQVLRTVKYIGWNSTFHTYVDIGTICPIDTDVIAWMPLPKPYNGCDTDECKSLMKELYID